MILNLIVKIFRTEIVESAQNEKEQRNLVQLKKAFVFDENI